jgi:hypothetical protein
LNCVKIKKALFFMTTGHPLFRSLVSCHNRDV